jgi:hypothetical protein
MDVWRERGVEMILRARESRKDEIQTQLGWKGATCLLLEEAFHTEA